MAIIYVFLPFLLSKEIANVILVWAVRMPLFKGFLMYDMHISQEASIH